MSLEATPKIVIFNLLQFIMPTLRTHELVKRRKEQGLKSMLMYFSDSNSRKYVNWMAARSRSFDE
jgi:hypothetical protein